MLKGLQSGPATALEIAAVLISGWIFAMAPDNPSILLGNAAFVMAVLVFAAQRGLVSRLLLTAPFLVAGAISYSIYMVHGLVETASLRIAERLLGHAGVTGLFMPDPGGARPVLTGDWRADAIGLAVLVIVFTAAWLLFRWFEWPLRQWSRRQVHRNAFREAAERI